MALLPNLVYLECHNISEEERESAAALHQGEIFKARNREDKAATEQQRSVIIREKRLHYSILKDQLLWAEESMRIYNVYYTCCLGQHNSLACLLSLELSDWLYGWPTHNKG